MRISVFERVEKLLFECLRVIGPNVWNNSRIIIPKLQIHLFVCDSDAVFAGRRKTISHALIECPENDAVVPFEIQCQFVITVTDSIFFVERRMNGFVDAFCFFSGQFCFLTPYCLIGQSHRNGRRSYYFSLFVIDRKTNLVFDFHIHAYFAVRRLQNIGFGRDRCNRKNGENR
jgi:hypothetical protein